jgi:site-specific recombinase XerD
MKMPKGARLPCQSQEILALRWCDLCDGERGGEVKLVHSRGGKERVISLPQDLLAALQKLHAERGADEEGFIFTSQKGGPLSVSQAERILTALANEAKIDKKVSPRTLRDSIATQLLDRGAPLQRVSKFLGHNDLKITGQMYDSESDYSDSGGLKVEGFFDSDSEGEEAEPND